MIYDFHSVKTVPKLITLGGFLLDQVIPNQRMSVSAARCEQHLTPSGPRMPSLL
jgi:hypothetical protein